MIFKESLFSYVSAQLWEYSSCRDFCKRLNKKKKFSLFSLYCVMGACFKIQITFCPFVGKCDLHSLSEFWAPELIPVNISLCCFLLIFLFMEWANQLKEGLSLYIIFALSLCTQPVENTAGQLLCILTASTENVGVSLFSFDDVSQILAACSNDWLHCWFICRWSSLFCNADLKL